MERLLFATNNAHKIDEIRSQLGKELEIISLKEAGIFEEIPEPWDTIEKNSTHKATYIHQKYGIACFSEDTGLIVPILNGEPGVYSARYAGENATSADNIEKLLEKLKEQKDRSAYFKTVITYCNNETMLQFEGICKGKIIAELRGEKGFGYDPIFVPDGSEKCFAEMDMKEKNIFSHRRKAMDSFLKSIMDNLPTEI